MQPTVEDDAVDEHGAGVYWLSYTTVKETEDELGERDNGSW